MSQPVQITETTIISSTALFTLDALINESHSSPLKITENPIESGSSITDNAILLPRPFEITGVMVDYNPNDTPLSKALEAVKIRAPDFINEIPIPARLKSITAQTLVRVESALDMVAATASQLVGGASGISWLAKKFPNILPAGVADMSVNDHRISDLYTALRSIQASGETVYIYSETAQYPTAIILDVKVQINVEGSAEFTLSCREVFIVNTQTTSGVRVPSDSGIGKTEGRTGSQTSIPQNKGKTIQKEVDLSEIDPDAREQIEDILG